MFILLKQNFISLALFCLLLLTLSLSSFANNLKSYDDSRYEKGASYFSKGDYATAFKVWLPLAEAADPAAQYSIALLYDQGKGVKKNPTKALKYLRLAANQELPNAQYYLAIKYYYGRDVQKSAFNARQLFTQAARQGHLEAQFQLANLYANGEGGRVEQEQAAYWYKKSSEGGYGAAQHSLAACFLTGKGVPRDIDRGVFWLNKAVEQHNSDALRDLGFMYYKGLGVAKDYKKAADLLLTPAKEGSGMALFILGKIYAQGGYGIRRDMAQAKKWYKKSHDSGYVEATKEIALLENQPIASQSSQPLVAEQPEIIIDSDERQEESLALNQPEIVAEPEIVTESEEIVVESEYVATTEENNDSVELISESTWGSASNSEDLGVEKSVEKNVANSVESNAENSVEQNALRFKELDENSYTLQLISTVEYRSISVLTDQYIDDQTFLLYTPKNTNTSYILAYGVYRNRADAKRAIIVLPKLFQLGSTPWIRKIKGLKQLM